MIASGIVVTFLGFLISLLSLSLTTSVTGRLVIVLLGIVVSLIGIVGVISPGFVKKAIWSK